MLVSFSCEQEVIADCEYLFDIIKDMMWSTKMNYKEFYNEKKFL